MANPPNPPTSETQTPPVAPSSMAAPLPSPPPMMTAGSLYIRSSRLPSFSRSPFASSFRMGILNPTPRFSHLGGGSGSNPVFQFGASSSRVENRNTPSGSGLRTETPLLGGGSGSNPVFQFGASSNRVENRNTPSGSGLRTETPLLGGGSGSNSAFQFGASSNRVENRNTPSGSGLQALGQAQSQSVGCVEKGDGEPVEPVAEKEVKTERSLKGKAPVVEESSDDDDSDDDSDSDSDSDSDDDSDEVSEVCDGEGVGNVAGDGVGDGEVGRDVAGDGIGNGGEDADGVEAGQGGGGGEGGEDGKGGGGAEDEESDEKTWNLRPRKTLNRVWDPEYSGIGGGEGSRSAPRPASRPRPTASKPRPAASKPRPAARRSRARAPPKKAAAVPPPPPPVAEKPKKKPGFSLTLTKEEIEHDFLLMTGALPPKKPQKRPKNVQKKLDELSPGMYLTPPTREQFP